jgi:hypothetical protein
MEMGFLFLHMKIDNYLKLNFFQCFVYIYIYIYIFFFFYYFFFKFNFLKKKFAL